MYAGDIFLSSLEICDFGHHFAKKEKGILSNLDQRGKGGIFSFPFASSVSNHCTTFSAHYIVKTLNIAASDTNLCYELPHVSGEGKETRLQAKLSIQILCPSPLNVNLRKWIMTLIRCFDASHIL
jgi:hypothetical protein